jgi:hypothetical protein
MTTSTKSPDTRTQLRNLMSQHTAASQSRPSAPIPARNPAPVAAHQNAPATPLPPSKPLASGDRCTVRLSLAEIAKVDTLTLEAHQRLGERITVSDVLRIGLIRVGTNAPITAEELAGLRSMDRRRSRG